MNPIDRAIILDEAKQYTNSQRIAYMEGQADITFDGNIEGKEIIPGSSLVKVSDTPYDLTKVKTVTQRLSNGTYATLAADAFTFEGAEGAAYLLYGNDACVVSSQKGSIFDEDAGIVGTFVLAVGSTWISKVEFAKTIHPIDPKFLPEETLDLTKPYIEGITSINDVVFLIISKGGGTVRIQSGANEFWKDAHELRPKYLNLSDGVADIRVTVSAFRDSLDTDGDMYISGSSIVSMNSVDMEVKCSLGSDTGTDIIIKVQATPIEFPEIELKE